MENVRHKFKMTVGQIIITDRPTSILENKVVKFLIGLVVIPPVIIFAILAVIYVVISDFITKKILGRPDKPIEFKEKVLFQNPNYKLVEEDILFGSDSNKLAEDFMWSIVDYDDEMYVYKVVADKETIELNNSFLTQFKLETEDEIYLQRITEKENKPFSELISLDKSTGKTKKVADVGLYSLWQFDEQTNEIVGSNRTNQIKIKVTDIKPVPNSTLPKAGRKWYKKLFSNKKTLS